MDSRDYWVQRKLETLKIIAEQGYELTNKMLSEFIANNFQTIDTLAKQLLGLSSKYGSLSELMESSEFRNLTYQMNVAIGQLSNKQRAWMKELLEFQVSNVMNETSAQLGFNFFLERNELDRLLNTDWVGDGKNWSYRVWGNKASLIDALNTTVKKGIREGWSIETLVNELSKKLQNISRARLVALARTESMHFINEAQRLTYKEAGVQHVEVMVAEDERTCEDCLNMDGTILSIGSPELPPYHPRCRCTIVPYMDTWKNLLPEDVY